MEYHSCYRMLLVLPIRAKDSCNKVRARERESANPGDGEPLGADVDTVLVTAPLSSHRFVLVRSELVVLDLLLLGKVCSAADASFVVCKGHRRHIFGFCCCYCLVRPLVCGAQYVHWA